MNSFYVEKEPFAPDKYYIAVKIIIYRNMLGKYPDFLVQYETSAKDGFSTKFAYLTDYTMLEKSVAEAKCEELEKRYTHILRECENSGDWSNSPFGFSKMDMLWSR